MKNMKQHIATTIIILGLVIIPPCASFAQAPDAAAEPEANPGVQQALGTANVTDIFTASRNGEAVTINIKIDFTPCNYVRVIRNTTGIATKRTMVGRVAPGVTTVGDVLPDPKPHWYWLQVVPKKGNVVTFGPIRVAPDTGNTGNYTDIATAYKWTVARTLRQAAINWNIPGDGLKFVEVLRKTNISDYGKRNVVFTSRENTGATVDPLPDPDADYWYWFAATLADGRVITQGPVKAEYSED